MKTLDYARTATHSLRPSSDVHPTRQDAVRLLRSVRRDWEFRHRSTRPHSRWSPALLALLAAAVCLNGPQASANILTVSNLNDSGSGSLRVAVSSSINGDTIVFGPGLTGTITLSNGAINISHSLNIQGPGANLLTVSGNHSNQVFGFYSGTFNLSGLTIANGFSPAPPGAGIFNQVTLTVSGCVISGNHSDGSGGGAIYNFQTGTLKLLNCAVSGNDNVHGSSGNSGGGLANYGTAVIVNTTFCTNRSVFGGAIANGSGAILLATNCTFAGNDAAAWGGALYDGGGQVTLRNSIVWGNTAGTGPDFNIGGTLTSGGFNLVGVTNSSTGWLLAGPGHDLIGVSPLMGPLQDNGGGTPTMALLPGSPALDAGHSSGVATDQRGRPRPYNISFVPNAPGGDGSDIGAFEVSSFWFHFDVTSSPGTNFVIQATTNLQSPVWVPLATNTSPFTFIDTEAGSIPCRFFRWFPQ